MLYLGDYAPEQSQGSGINTLSNLRIELDASRQLVSRNPENYFRPGGERWLNLVAQLVESQARGGGGLLPARLSSFPALGLLASRIELALADGNPQAESLVRQFCTGAPPAILSDSGADVGLWPCSRQFQSVLVQQVPALRPVARPLD